MSDARVEQGRGYAHKDTPQEWQAMPARQQSSPHITGTRGDSAGHTS